MRIAISMVMSLAFGGWLFADAAAEKSPIANSPVVETRGTIEKVQLAMGEGMPYLIVKNGGKSVRVYLGAMRYLMEQNFNPKAGAEVTAKGYKLNDGIMAITVTLPAENKTLKLRDADGWPVWRQGQHGRGHRHGQGKK